MNQNQVLGYGRDARPERLAALLHGSPFIAYGYAYPHKTTYRPLARPRPLAEVWAEEDQSALFLYVHVPFCAVRCGFCNLFTQKQPAAELPARWLETLERQISVVREAVPAARFARWALGGGTPTLLEAPALERLLASLRDGFDLDLPALPSSAETSPETCTDDRLAVLEAAGTQRISIGIQSFDPRTLAAMGRPQGADLGEAALDRIRARRFPVLNIDLIYGAVGQTPAGFVADIDRALRWRPEQLYLYPLYQRPLTGLGRHDRSWDDQRMACLRAGRDHLLASGYRQKSMRMFVRDAAAGSQDAGPAYCCQADGMIGLGVGARSYTRALHYSDAWAVGAPGVRDIVADWIERSPAQLAQAWYGVALDGEEQRRRWLIQSLLQAEGLHRRAYAERFSTRVDDDFRPEITELLELRLLTDEGTRLVPTPRGLEWADALAPWLYSEASRAASRDFELR
ncbi:STM4012 family radical SAM protein [Pseudenhygromyxa sp. WMMC2535]|uniref:STM4012 family radical SAM protein n=1 Tax=Pseudenhygromyxa sp. WMMC2535 TaxID=2712867 RepID=UPI001552C0A0|nr:STM4012 family radical SAM protein [Pseudenhygromyxa sp. WMMC2535]NVB41095.1 STM4012 family radical SAM protein [Pseudenhygromyxa sp. WMMC2535]